MKAAMFEPCQGCPDRPVCEEKQISWNGSEAVVIPGPDCHLPDVPDWINPDECMAFVKKLAGWEDDFPPRYRCESS